MIGVHTPQLVVPVTRIVPRPVLAPVDLPAGVVEIGERAHLALGPFEVTGQSLVARSRLHARGLHVTRLARVTVEITPGLCHGWELTIRPISRRVPNWGQRRSRRYFHLAHTAADRLVDAFATPNPRPGTRQGLIPRPAADVAGAA